MRHIKTCLRYPGGKFYGFKVLEPFLMVPHNEFREVFVGGASIYLGKGKSQVNWINDIDKELINFYKIISNEDSKKELYSLLHNEKASKKST